MSDRPDTNRENKMSKTVMIDGVEYAPTAPLSGDVRIVVFHRGFVAVGHYDCDDGQVTLSRASVIRRWGTTRGLGEIAAGPTGDTVLDPAGTIRCAELAVVLTIDADEAGWREHLS